VTSRWGGRPRDHRVLLTTAVALWGGREYRPATAEPAATTPTHPPEGACYPEPPKHISRVWEIRIRLNIDYEEGKSDTGDGDKGK
jgi:hypothetical protein